jgi:hypothetical protein
MFTAPLHLKLVVVQKLKDQFVQKWRADITADQRLQSYCVIKDDFGMEVYFKKLKYYTNLCKFRVGSYKLQTAYR